MSDSSTLPPAVDVDAASNSDAGTSNDVRKVTPAIKPSTPSDSASRRGVSTRISTGMAAMTTSAKLLSSIADHPRHSPAGPMSGGDGVPPSVAVPGNVTHDDDQVKTAVDGSGTASNAVAHDDEVAPLRQRPKASDALNPRADASPPRRTSTRVRSLLVPYSPTYDAVKRTSKLDASPPRLTNIRNVAANVPTVKTPSSKAILTNTPSTRPLPTTALSSTVPKKKDSSVLVPSVFLAASPALSSDLSSTMPKKKDPSDLAPSASTAASSANSAARSSTKSKKAAPSSPAPSTSSTDASADDGISMDLAVRLASAVFNSISIIQMDRRPTDPPPRVVPSAHIPTPTFYQSNWTSTVPPMPDQYTFNADTEPDTRSPAMEAMHDEAVAVMTKVFPGLVPTTRDESASLLRRYEHFINRVLPEAPSIVIDWTQLNDNKLPPLKTVVEDDYFSDAMMDEFFEEWDGEAERLKLKKLTCSGPKEICKDSIGCHAAADGPHERSMGRLVVSDGVVKLVPTAPVKIHPRKWMPWLYHDELYKRIMFLCWFDCHDDADDFGACSQFYTNMVRKSPVIIFRDPVKGWSLYSLRPIPANTFIVSPTGECLTDAEWAVQKEKPSNLHFGAWSMRRNELRNGVLCTHKLALDMHMNCENKSNLAVLLNHNCAPTLVGWSVFTKRHGFARVAYTARTDLPAGTELTYDYFDGGVPQLPEEIDCKCGNCRHPNRAEEEKERAAKEKQRRLDEKRKAQGGPQPKRGRPAGGKGV